MVLDAQDQRFLILPTFEIDQVNREILCDAGKWNEYPAVLVFWCIRNLSDLDLPLIQII